MRLGLPRPGTVKHRLASLVAIVWIGLLAGFGGPEAYRQVHDGLSLEGCATGFVTAVTDRQIAKDHIPPSNDLHEILAYVIPFEQTFHDRIVALDCPSTLGDEQRDLAYRSELWLRYLERMDTDPDFYDPTWVAIRSTEISNSIDTMTYAIQALVPQPEEEQTTP